MISTQAPARTLEGTTTGTLQNTGAIATGLLILTFFGSIIYVLISSF